MAKLAVRSGRLLPQLGRGAWVVLAADLLSAVGSGMTLPFLLVYLHSVRGLSLPVAGAAAASLAAASFVGNPLGGFGSDRIGPRATLAGGLAVASAGAFILAGVNSPAQAFAGAVVSGFGVAIAWPAQDALLAQLEPASGSSVFAVRYATMNLGLAIGAASAAAIVSGYGSGSYVFLYTLDGVSFLLATPLLAIPATGRKRLPAFPEEPEPPAARAPAGGYGTLLRDSVFRRLWLLTALLVTVGYGQFNASYPVYLTEVAGVSPRTVALAFSVNTLTVVLAQLVVLRVLRGHRRTSALAGVAAAWGATWAVTLAAGQAGHHAAVALAVLAAATFAVGETLLAPSVPAIVNDIAPEHLRGRYNAGSALAYTTGFVIGPAIAGLALALGNDAATGLLAGLVLACAIAAALAVGLARRLPAHANLVEGASDGGTGEPTGGAGGLGTVSPSPSPSPSSSSSGAASAGGLPADTRKGPG